MKAKTQAKEALWETSWNLLKRGKVDPKHPFSTPVLCTLTPTLHPRSRTLVLRKVLRPEAQLWCYTDRRSQKAQDIAAHPAVSWTFWAPKPKIQLNVFGQAHWLATEKAQAIFRSLPQHSRKAYATLSAPGHPQQLPSDGLPENWDSRDLQQTNYAAANFGVMVTQIESMEILQLSREGHLRLRATRDLAQTWQLQWLVP